LRRANPAVGQPSSLSDHPPLDDSIPPGASVPQTAETDANKVEDTYRYPLLSVEAVSSQLYSPQLLFWSLSSAETASLLSRCRQAQTTIYAAICAAFFLVIASEGETQSQRNEPLICLSPIEAVYGPALVSPIKENYGVITVATVGGRMFFTLTYSGIGISPDQAKQMQQTAMQHLLA